VIMKAGARRVETLVLALRLGSGTHADEVAEHPFTSAS
jgi:hypothetical protein